MKIAIPGPVGQLEAVFDRPAAAGEPRAAAIVCHPHPLFGGTMGNNLVSRIARALQAAGLATLRFNFRGVGSSEGVHDGKGGEQLDASAALDWLAAQVPEVPLWATGFSFGSRTVCALSVREERIRRTICVALPVRAYDLPCASELTRPAFFLFGSRDEFGTLADLRERFPVLPAHVEVDEIEGADHFFRGRTPLVEERVRAYALRALEES